mgnify:CR=1 FL=1
MLPGISTDTAASASAEADASEAASRSAAAAPESSCRSGADGTPCFQRSCPRCGELAAFLDQLLPLLNAATGRSSVALAADGSQVRVPWSLLHGRWRALHLSAVLTVTVSRRQDEVVMMPLAAALDVPNTAAVLQRLGSVVGQLKRLEDQSAALAADLAAERAQRSQAEAAAARLAADRDAAAAKLSNAERRLSASQVRVDELRGELDDKVGLLQQQLSLSRASLTPCKRCLVFLWLC